MTEPSLHPLGLWALGQYLANDRSLSQEHYAILRQGLGTMAEYAEALTSAVISVAVVIELAKRDQRSEVEEALTALIKELRPEFAALRERIIAEKGGRSEAEVLLDLALKTAPQFGAARPEGTKPPAAVGPIMLRG